jgi:hypothetical protein
MSGRLPILMPMQLREGRMRINRKILGVSVLAVCIILVLVIVALPVLLRHLAVKKIDAATGRKSTISDITLNPFTLTAAVKGFRLSEKGSGATFLSFSSAKVSLSPLSLPKRSFIITEASVASPYLHAVRNAPNQYNFSDLVTPKKNEKKGEGTPLFSLNNITISHGTLDFQDKGVKSERFHHVGNLALSVPFVSNMPYLADRYVLPHFSAVINNSPFSFDGRLKPLNRAVEATIDLDVKRVDLPFYLGYLPFPLPVKVTSGTLGTKLEIGYRVDAKKGPELRVAGNVALDRAAIADPKGAPLVALDRAALQIRNAWLMSRHLDIQSLQLDGPELYVDRDRSGATSFQKLSGGAKTRESKAPEGAKKTPPLDLRLGKLSVKDGKIHLADHLPPGGFKTELKELAVSVDDISLVKGHRSPLEVKFSTQRGETALLKGDVALAPVEFAGKVTLSKIPLKDYYPYLSGTLTAPVSGSVDVSSGIAYSGQTGITLDKGRVTGNGLAAPFGKGEGLTLKEAVISGIGVDLKRSKAKIERVDLRGGNLALSGEQDGKLSYQRLLKTGKSAGRSEVQAKEKRNSRDKKVKSQPFSYSIRNITGSGFGIKYTDRSKEEAPTFTLRGLNFTLSGVAGPKQGPIPLRIASGYGRSGRIAADGTLTPEPLHFKGNVMLRGITLRDFDPYIPDDTSIFIADGALDTRLALDLEKRPSGIVGSFAGSGGVRSFYCQDTETDEDLLKWERLQLDEIKGTISPLTLAINEVSLTNFYSRIIVEKDGTLNVQHLRHEEPSATARPVPVATRQIAAVPDKEKSKSPLSPLRKGGDVVERSPVPKGGEPHPIRIETITMQGGTLAFSDHHLEAPFDTTFYNLGGRVSGLSSQVTKLADVDLRGNLENHSPLSIKGVINPLRGDLYLDLQIAFNDIELSPFTPYSNTYLGYNVDKGKLFLNLSYKIDKGALSSQNKVFIDQFTFGKEVDSPKATKLPVRLAVALLKDRKGEIHLDLPVAGRTDDPKFSVWKVVLQVLKNLLVKAATSPMALLGSMFGGGEDFSSIAFAPGSEQLSKAEQEKLNKLSKVLHDRPDLKLEVAGFVDRDSDAEGYRNEMLLKKMKGEKFRKLIKEGKKPEELTPQELEILPAEYPGYLKDVYRKEKFPKPRNILGLAKELPDAEMKKLIITHTVVGNNELQALARERTGAVKAYLVKEGIPAERLYEKSGDIYKPAAKGAGGRVEFGASVK